MSEPSTRIGPWWKTSALALALLGWTASAGRAETIVVDGFMEPYQSVNVAAADSGIIDQLNVREGQAIRENQILASLDCKLLYRSLAIAEEEMKGQGRLKSARAKLKLASDRLESFEEVLASGHARQEEVNRARAELRMAEGNLLSVEEDLRVKALEYERIKAQIERRNIRSPVEGFVRRIVKDKGEFAAPNDPTVLTVVQLNFLLATFSVPANYAKDLELNQTIQLRLKGRKSTITGIIDVIDPVTDAESGNILIKIKVENADGRYRSGERCILQLADPDAASKVSRSSPRRSKPLPARH